MPVPKTNKTPETVDEFIAGAEEWGDTEIFSEDKLRAFCKRMMDAQDDYDADINCSVSRKKKIIINVYHPCFQKAAIMSDLIAGGYKACNGLLNEIFRLREQLKSLRTAFKEAGIGVEGKGD